MASIDSNDLALKVARAAQMRAGTSRAAFVDVATEGTTAGSSGGFYIWRRVAPVTTSWTQVSP